MEEENEALKFIGLPESGEPLRGEEGIGVLDTERVAGLRE